MSAIDAKILDWMIYGRVGASARTMAIHLTGRTQPDRFSGRNWPVDAEDFGCCMDLLDSVPELRDELHRMIELGIEWLNLVGRWEAIEASLREERNARGYVSPPTPRTDALIRSCLAFRAEAA